MIQSLNSIHDNIWALLLIGGGAVLAHWDRDAGMQLITLGAAVFQKRSQGDSPQKETQ